ncbi:LLM class flavin-dependent oxidoreductase [Tepidiforma flava]|uniref:LLM class flavin-dependent oxidoreductase n=1 Tax=Tepidiforma flava TaxID=3004094 RepID=A0ABY7M827_9CHLR|nr:LLM class flavin-dependent oxidoreductase [Tepidiforma flava]WBL36585.1 LLM class flavin-dependent oxidoreductase [Tepidiforma flava]
MKFHWFNLMPYPYLPDDFRQNHRSVWVDVDSRLYDPVKGHRIYHDYLDLLEFAAELGFDGIGVNEHHANAYGLMPSPALMAATLARRTRDVSIVLLGMSIALYNPPTRVAEEMAMLDVISGGRLIAGFPVGTSMDTNYAFGANPATLRERYQENHDLIIRAWTDPDVFPWNGKFNKLRYVNIWPRPIQKPHPPIWIPGGGSIETWDFCAERGYNYSYLSFSGFKRAAQLMNGFHDRVAELGLPFNPYQASFAQQIIVAESEAEAEESYFPHAKYFFERCLHIYPGFADAPGYRTEATILAGLKAQVGGVSSGGAVGKSFRQCVDEGFLIAGTPDQVTEQMEHLITSLRVGHVFCLLHIGDMPREKCEKSTRLFAEKVMPRLRHLWQGYEDRWSPKPLPAQLMAEPRPIRQPVQA